MDGESSQQPSPARTSSAQGASVTKSQPSEPPKPVTEDSKNPHAEAMTLSALAEPSAPAPAASDATPVVDNAVADPQPVQDGKAPESSAPQTAQPDEAHTGFFHADKSDVGSLDTGSANAPAQPSAASASLEWIASGTHVGARSKIWYVGLIFVGIIIAALVYLVTKDIFSSVIVALCAPIFGFISTKKPHDLHYRIDGGGITIGAKHYLFQQFRAFAIVDEGAGRTSIVMIPLQRFSPLLSVSYDPEMQSRVVDAMSGRLPVEQYKRDIIDHIVSRLKF